MIDVHELVDLIQRMDKSRYSRYKRLLGLVVKYRGFTARLTKIQGDPYAPPSIIEVRIPGSTHKFPRRFFDEKLVTAFTDFLSRRLYEYLRGKSRKCGTGNSCYLGIPRPGPWILERSCVEASGHDLVLRFYIGLPARGRRILGDYAEKILVEHVPSVVRYLSSTSLSALEKHVRNYLDQEYLRSWLEENNYAVFIGDNSILPRESSLSLKPMRNAVPFKSPGELRVSVRLPSGRLVSGMALPVGFIVVTGGGYHGKTTLLEAVQEGIYDHVEDDGRELVVSRKYTVLVRAEDGRIISSVDISSFIEGVPGGANTSNFSSLDASGSTSMAASINEAMEAGAELLLIDEDTSATNLLYKDEEMSSIIRREPIKPLSTQVEDFIRKTGIGVIAIASASSALLRPADKIILVEEYLPRDITMEAKKILEPLETRREYHPPKTRMFHGIRGLRKIRSRGYKLVAVYDDNTRFELDLVQHPRIVEKTQVNFIAHVLRKIKNMEKPLSTRRLIEYINELFKNKGFKAFSNPVPPDLARVDGFDILWVLNRMYNAVFKQ